MLDKTLHWEKKNVFKSVRRFSILIYVAILENACNIWLAFLNISSVWELKVSLKSYLLLSNISHLLILIGLFSTSTSYYALAFACYKVAFIGISFYLVIIKPLKQYNGYMF